MMRVNLRRKNIKLQKNVGISVTLNHITKTNI